MFALASSSTPVGRLDCSNKFRLRVWDPFLNKSAVWTYWQGAYRDTGKNEGATMVLQTADKQGWFWYIPLHDDRVSVGIVAPAKSLLKNRGPREQIYTEEVEKCAAIKERLAGATRVTGYFVTKDYSYRATQAAGEGWVMIGDAYAFLDPLYSSGVLLALRSGEMAADAIVDGLAKGDTSGAQLGRWRPIFDEGVNRMRRLVCDILRRLQLRPVRADVPRTARHGDGPTHRRSVHGQSRQGVGADAIALSRQ